MRSVERSRQKEITLQNVCIYKQVAVLTAPLRRGRGIHEILGHKCLPISAVPNVTHFVY